jgi:2-polyprenyl-3-methyl-5-hydroxy-6-metoxy-1,4-benzoquinol methylase
MRRSKDMTRTTLTRDSLDPAIQEYYDWLSVDRWEKVYRDPVLRYEFAMRHVAVLEMLAPQPEMLILDDGCGDGIFIQDFVDRCKRVIATDISQDMLRHGKSRLAGKPIDWIESNGTRLPFRSESFDAAVSLEVIEHVPDAAAFARELHRVLKPGGRIVISTPNRLSAYSLTDSLVRSRAWICLTNLIRGRPLSTAGQHPPYDNWRTPDDLEALLREAGFAVEEVRTTCFLPGAPSYSLPIGLKWGVTRLAWQDERWLQRHSRRGYSIVIRARRA